MADSNFDLLKLYDEKILPIGISASGKTDEIIDIVSDYTWSAQQFSQRNTGTNKATYTHNIPFCYAIERTQTVGSGAANVLNTLLGQGGALLTISGKTWDNIVQLTSRGGNAVATALSGGDGGEKKPTDSGNSTAGKEQKPAAAGQTVQAQSQAETPANGENKEGWLTSVGNWTGELLAGQKSIFSSLYKKGQEWAGAASPRMLESNLSNNRFLEPWRWLYMTKTTSKKYVFPAFSANDLLTITNAWGQPGEKVAGIFQSAEEFLSKWAERVRGAKELLDLLPSEGQSISYEMYNVESALGYNYNATGPTFKVRFPLFNTTKKDAWKKNYRFILLFLLRNMPLRTDLFSYKVPLLYDIIVPGVKRLPLCYVANANITAEGHVRNLSMDNILKEIVSDAKSSTTLVPVPEAWTLDLTFKCLIPDTMNLALDLTSFPINVTSVTR